MRVLIAEHADGSHQSIRTPTASRHALALSDCRWNSACHSATSATTDNSAKGRTPSGTHRWSRTIDDHLPFPARTQLSASRATRISLLHISCLGCADIGSHWKRKSYTLASHRTRGCNVGHRCNGGTSELRLTRQVRRVAGAWNGGSIRDVSANTSEGTARNSRVRIELLSDHWCFRSVLDGEHRQRRSADTTNPAAV